MGKDVVMHFAIDSELGLVRQTFNLGQGTWVVEYQDRAFKPLIKESPLGEGVAIEHFVRINADIIYFGNIVKQVEEGTTIDRKTGAIALPAGVGGKCQLLPRR